LPTAEFQTLFFVHYHVPVISHSMDHIFSTVQCKERMSVRIEIVSGYVMS